MVKQKGPTYFPCPQWNSKGDEETPDFDEVVVFQKRQVLPRYIIYYRRTQDQPRTQSFVNPRFEQIDESSHTHAPLTILWVDNPNPESELMRKLLRNGMPATSREVISFVSSDELKVRWHTSTSTSTRSLSLTLAGVAQDALVMRGAQASEDTHHHE